MGLAAPKRSEGGRLQDGETARWQDRKIDEIARLEIQIARLQFEDFPINRFHISDFRLQIPIGHSSRTRIRFRRLERQ